MSAEIGKIDLGQNVPGGFLPEIHAGDRGVRPGGGAGGYTGPHVSPTFLLDMLIRNGGMKVNYRQLEQIGETLRSLGHERREVVEQIVSTAQNGSHEAGKLYRDLDRISERCIDLMEQQRSLVEQELRGDGGLS